MFNLIRRISHGVIPRPDRPWEEDGEPYTCCEPFGTHIKPPFLGMAYLVVHADHAKGRVSDQIFPLDSSIIVNN